MTAAVRTLYVFSKQYKGKGVNTGDDCCILTEFNNFLFQTDEDEEKTKRRKRRRKDEDEDAKTLRVEETKRLR